MGQRVLGWVLVVAGCFLLLAAVAGVPLLTQAEGPEVAVAGITVVLCLGLGYLGIKHGWRRARPRTPTH